MSRKCGRPEERERVRGRTVHQSFTALLTVFGRARRFGRLTYDVRVLEGAAPAKGGSCSLFIDIIGMPLTPYSYAGAERRAWAYGPRYYRMRWFEIVVQQTDRREDPEKVVAKDGPEVAVIAGAYSGREMLESFLEKYGYLAILVGTAIEGETVLIIGGFTAHRGYLSLFPWVILAGFAGNYIQNHVFFMIGRRYGIQAVEKHPEWRRRLQKVDRWLERYRSSLTIGVRFMPGFHTVGGVAIGMSGITLGRFAVLNGLAALMWALVFGCLGYICGHAMELILGDIKHLEVPILVGLAACGVLWFFYRRRRVGR